MMFTVQLTLVECYKCGISFGMPDEFDDNRREDKKAWYCPNGHAQVYVGKSQKEKLAEERQRVVRLQRQLDHQREVTETERRRAAAHKGVATRIKRRVAAGCCPCCKETFDDLANHMIENHPDYATEEVGS